MTTLASGLGHLSKRQTLPQLSRRGCTRCATPNRAQPLARRTPTSIRDFSSSSGKRPRFSQRLGDALKNSKIQWYQIPVGLGIGFLGLVQFYKVSSREREKQRQLENGEFEDGTPVKRPRVKLEGPW